MNDLYIISILGNLGASLAVTGFLCLLVGAGLYVWHMTTSMICGRRGI